MSTQFPTTWITIGVYPTKHEVLLLGIADNRRECESHRDRCKHPFIEAFPFDGQIGPQLTEWLREIGVELRQINPVVRMIGHELLRIIEAGEANEPNC